MTDLPISKVLPDLIAALRRGSNAVLVAPPGAGKTTAIAPALLCESWCAGQILLLSPRRLAARAAAERMAALMGEAVGRTVGYATRLDSRHSPDTRILVLTEGIFRNRIQRDAELTGVSAVLFDEVHERSLDSDFALALALDAQGGLRPDLRLLAMSATLDGGKFAHLMDDCPIVESQGRAWPLDLRHIGRRTELRLEDDVAAAVRTALADDKEGDVLVFLPGVAEIERTSERLSGLVNIAVHMLHGSLDPAAQRAAMIPDPERRKVVLATSIAETSLTIDGVRIVIDSGLSRRPRLDHAAGVTRLVTEKASQASATQRAGRAARQGPGVAYRLWETAATAGRAAFDPPEILEAELSGLLLDCATWGVADPRTLRWLDPPPEASLAEARRRLSAIDALEADGRITPHGRAVAVLPLEPRIAHMLVKAGERGLGTIAARIAVLIAERGLGGGDVDMSVRLRRWAADRGKRAQGARMLAERWAALVDPARSTPPNEADMDEEKATGLCLALAFPDRVSRRRGSDGTDWISVGGRGFRLDPLSPLAREEWLAVGEVQGSASGARILSAAPIEEAAIRDLFAARIEQSRTVRFRADTSGVETLRETRLGAVALSKGGDDAPDPQAIAGALIDGVRIHGLDLLPWSASAQSLRKRAAFAGVTDLDDDALLAELNAWLAPLVVGRRSLRDVDPGALNSALEARIGWDQRKRIDALAPESLLTPAGTQHRIDYAAAGGPEVEVRVQALYGLAHHPTIGPRHQPLRLSLTSPAGRPIQTTSDLPGFWAGSWADVAKEMRGRYPRHNWPDDPAAAPASLRTKRAEASRKS